jgi:beta-lactamase class A
LYRAGGNTRTLAQLADLMITVSSNLATNLLIETLAGSDGHLTKPQGPVQPRVPFRGS